MWSTGNHADGDLDIMVGRRRGRLFIWFAVTYFLVAPICEAPPLQTALGASACFGAGAIVNLLIEVAGRRKRPDFRLDVRQTLIELCASVFFWLVIEALIALAMGRTAWSQWMETKNLVLFYVAVWSLSWRAQSDEDAATIPFR